MANGKGQARKQAKRLKELWGARPMAGFVTNKAVKRICHRIERARAKVDTRRQVHG